MQKVFVAKENKVGDELKEGECVLYKRLGVKKFALKI